MSHQHHEPVPKIIFVHGFLDDHTVWHDVIGLLDDGFDAKALDLPGSGSRSNDAGPFTLQSLAEAVINEVDAATEPVVLVGHSMGAQIVELAAGARLSRVVGLVLLTPIPLAGVQLSGETAESFRSLGGDREAQRQGRLGVTVALSPQAVELLLASGTALDPAVVAQVFDVWNDGDPAGLQSSTFSGPTLVVNGKNDPFVTDQLLTSGVLPRFERLSAISIDQAGHIPHLEQPAEVARIVSDFARSTSKVEA